MIFGDPAEQPNSQFFAVDRRQTNEFIETRGRAWLHGLYVTFPVPFGEIGTTKGLGFRGEAFWGSSTARGNPAFGEQDVAPGGRHAPFGFLRYSG